MILNGFGMTLDGFRFDLKGFWDDLGRMFLTIFGMIFRRCFYDFFYDIPLIFPSSFYKIFDVWP